MSQADSLWAFHQKEVTTLKDANIHAVGLCHSLQRLFSAIRDDTPLLAGFPIKELIEKHGNYSIRRIYHLLKQVDHLIKPFGVSINVPRRNGLKAPDLGVTTVFSLAHEAVQDIWITMEFYFLFVVYECYPNHGWGLDDLFLSDDLTKNHWSRIRRELENVINFDVERLKRALESETAAAIDHCRKDIIHAGILSDSERRRIEGTEDKRRRAQ